MPEKETRMVKVDTGRDPPGSTAGFAEGGDLGVYVWERARGGTAGAHTQAQTPAPGRPPDPQPNLWAGWVERETRDRGGWGRRSRPPASARASPLRRRGKARTAQVLAGLASWLGWQGRQAEARSLPAFPGPSGSIANPVPTRSRTESPTVAPHSPPLPWSPLMKRWPCPSRPRPPAADSRSPFGAGRRGSESGRACLAGPPPRIESAGGGNSAATIWEFAPKRYPKVSSLIP